MPRPPHPLLDELVEEVLFRLPPHEPAELVRAALVCRHWRRLVSDPAFRRRYREFHRRPPVLGMICNESPRFVPTTSFCVPQANRGYVRALDARHGRVLLGERRSVVVWDPNTDEEQELHLPQWQPDFGWNGAVLCSAAAGTCDHLDCHHRPFLVVIVWSRPRSKGGETLVYTYSSDAATWGDPVYAQKHDYQYRIAYRMGNALIENTLYFGSLYGGTVLKYNVELRQMSWIHLPSQARSGLSVLTTTEDGALGLVAEDDSKLYIWSRKDTHEVDAIWERRVIIELNTVFPVDVVLNPVYVIGSADGLGIIFMWVGKAVYTIDLKTYKVNKVYEGAANLVFPYVNFHTPALGGTCTGEGPSASRSSA